MKNVKNIIILTNLNYIIVLILVQQNIKNNCYNDCPNGTIKDKVNYICNDITNTKNIQSTIVIKTYEKDSNSLIDKKTDYTNEKRTDNIENKNENLNNIVEFVNNTNNNDPKIKDEVLERIKDLFNNGFDTSNIDKGKDFIINVDEVKYSITTTINQKYNNKKMNQQLTQVNVKIN